jgi:hypothetical protein
MLDYVQLKLGKIYFSYGSSTHSNRFLKDIREHSILIRSFDKNRHCLVEICKFTFQSSDDYFMPYAPKVLFDYSDDKIVDFQKLIRGFEIFKIKAMQHPCTAKYKATTQFGMLLNYLKHKNIKRMEYNPSTNGFEVRN